MSPTHCSLCGHQDATLDDEAAHYRHEKIGPRCYRDVAMVDLKSTAKPTITAARLRELAAGGEASKDDAKAAAREAVRTMAILREGNCNLSSLIQHLERCIGEHDGTKPVDFGYLVDRVEQLCTIGLQQLCAGE